MGHFCVQYANAKLAQQKKLLTNTRYKYSEACSSSGYRLDFVHARQQAVTPLLLTATAVHLRACDRVVYVDLVLAVSLVWN